MYIGAIPTPAATESRQEFTATANQTVYNTTGGTVGFCDCYLNGVKLANSDFSFDGADVTLTTGAAAGDTLAVVMRQADNALVALPIKDSAGNNVLSETSNVVSIDSGVKFPAGNAINVASVVRTDATFNTSNATPQTALTLNYKPETASSKILVMFSLSVGINLNTHAKIAMFRDSTEIFKGDSSGHQAGHAHSFNVVDNAAGATFVGTTFLDSPSTDTQVTYTARLGSNGGVVVYLNRSGRDDDNSSGNYDGRYASSLTLIEFA